VFLFRSQAVRFGEAQDAIDGDDGRYAAGTPAAPNHHLLTHVKE
jgi:hypothetical protein